MIVKKLIFVLSVLVSGQAFAIEYKCEDIGLEKVMTFLQAPEPKEEFLQHTPLVFSCKSRQAPDTEIYQWGDGTALVGIEFQVRNGVCVVTEEPYSGQDDGDLDYDWFESYCQQ